MKKLKKYIKLIQTFHTVGSVSVTLTIYYLPTSYL